MFKVKRYIISVSTMVLVSVVLLVVLATLTYMFKWQADKAMIGIIVTYVAAGIVGGYVLRKAQKRDGVLEKDGVQKRDEVLEKEGTRGQIGKAIMQAGVLAGIYLGLLALVSVIFLKNELEFTKQMLLVCGLEFGSVSIGKILAK